MVRFSSLTSGRPGHRIHLTPARETAREGTGTALRRLYTRAVNVSYCGAAGAASRLSGDRARASVGTHGHISQARLGDLDGDEVVGVALRIDLDGHSQRRAADAPNIAEEADNV